MLELINAIDLHTHYNHGSPYDTQIHPLYNCDLDYLMTEYDNTTFCAVAFPVSLRFCLTRRLCRKTPICMVSRRIIAVSINGWLLTPGRRMPLYRRIRYCVLTSVWESRSIRDVMVMISKHTAIKSLVMRMKRMPLC